MKNYQKLQLLLIAIESIITSQISKTGVLDETEFIKMLNDYSITIEDIKKLVMCLTIIGCPHLEKYTTEYKKINGLYQEVLQNSKELFKMLEVDRNPIEAFALYVYLYRNGYLSYQHKFVYDNPSKDFIRLYGVDVVLGSGVCRSISSMFSDVCRVIGMDAKNVYVKIDEAKYENPKLLSAPSIEIGRKNLHSEISEKIIKLMPFANHVVNAVSSSNKQRILDPTNIVSLYRGDKNRLYIEGASNNKYIKINYISKNIMVLLGNSSLESSHVQRSKNEDHSIEKYKEVFVKTYDNAYKKITENLGILEQFYQENEDLYREIHESSTKKYSYFKK